MKKLQRLFAALITMSPSSSPSLPLLPLPDTLPHSWQQQTKQAGFSGLRRGRAAFDLSPLRRRSLGGVRPGGGGKVTLKSFFLHHLKARY